jgi:hypothetical protein
MPAPADRYRYADFLRVAAIVKLRRAALVGPGLAGAADASLDLGPPPSAPRPTRDPHPGRPRQTPYPTLWSPTASTTRARRGRPTSRRTSRATRTVAHPRGHRRNARAWRPAANWTSGRITRGGIADRVLHRLLVVDDDAHRTRSDRPCYGDRVSGRPSDDVPLQRIRTAIELLEIAEDMLRQRLRRTHSEVPPEDIEDLVRSWLERRPGAELGDAPGVPRGIPGR